MVDNIVIDLDHLKSKQLNELNTYDFDAALGAKVKLILNNMFGGPYAVPHDWVPVSHKTLLLSRTQSVVRRTIWRRPPDTAWEIQGPIETKLSSTVLSLPLRGLRA